ncbi:MAG TPA: HAD-IA family hydrolase [Patescibacteria group bacterium]|nr:HAD-IA family hydrolase [Patescibacteria group bacterium]
MIKAILFDIDDTLIKTFETKKEALKDMGRMYYDTKLDDETIRTHWGKPIKELLSILFKNIKDLEEGFERYVIARELYPTVAYEDAINTINTLSKKHLLGLITNKSKRYINDDLTIAKIPQDLFFIIQTEEDNIVHKPDPRVFDFTLNELTKKGVKKNEVIYIGDTVSDFMAASGAGIKFYAIAGRTTPKSEFDKLHAKTISTLSELVNLL